MKYLYTYKLFENIKDLDAEYRAALHSNNKKLINKLVKDQANTMGYTIGPVYHGTDSDFTEFDIDKSNMRFYGDNQMMFFFAFDKKNATAPSMNKPKRIIHAYIKGDIQGTYGEDDNGEDKLIPVNADHVILGNLSVSVKNPEQIKLADNITYDDKGKIIMLSKRFDNTKKDMRY